MDAPDKPGPPDGPRRVDVTPRLDPVTSALRCPFCHDPVRLEVPTPWVACAACLARHHGSCWDESRRCGACGHGTRLRPDVKHRTWLRLLASAALGSLLTVLALTVTQRGRLRVTIDDGPIYPGERMDPSPAPLPVEPPPEPPPAQDAVDLSHVHVGQRYVYGMQNHMQQIWTVREVGPDFVKYEMRMIMGGNPLGDPVTQEWRYAAPYVQTTRAEQATLAKTTRERVTVSGIEFDCMVSEASGYRSWVTMTPGSATVWTFPGPVKTIQLSDGAVIIELTRIERGPERDAHGNGGTTSSGYRLSRDRTQVQDSTGAWVPYDPSFHGDLPD